MNRRKRYKRYLEPATQDASLPRSTAQRRNVPGSFNQDEGQHSAPYFQASTSEERINTPSPSGFPDIDSPTGQSSPRSGNHSCTNDDDSSSTGSIDLNSTQYSDANFTDLDDLGDDLPKDSFEEFTPIYKEDRLNDLLPNLKISIFEVMMMVQTFSLRHNLTMVAREDLIKLINTVLGKDIIPESKFIFSKVFNPQISHEKHFYCRNCTSYIGKHLDSSTGLNCPLCKEIISTSENDSGNPNFFVSISMNDQLKLKLEELDIEEKLKHRFERQCSGNEIKDIYDGKRYKTLSKEGSILSNKNNFSITFNTDGAPIFKSNKYSIWPIQYYLNELPPSCRYQPENLMLAGLWFGEKEPLMHIFLRPFVQQAVTLEEEGVQWKRSSTGEEVTSKVVTLCCCLDTVAKPAVQCLKQFNGYYGCSYCLHPGDLINNSQVRYTTKLSGAERSNKTIRKDMETSFAEDRIVNGVKSISPLYALEGFDLVFGFTLDYMHACLLGVARALANLWFESSNHTQPFYIGLQINEVDKRLKALKPPSNISRLHRPISDRCHWKANEWRNWVLFYSLPCLKSVLPPKYFNHFALFVTCIFFFLKDSITHHELDEYNELMQQFVQEYETLYGEINMTINVHLLSHLGMHISLWGPLWVYSAFTFESGNGTLVNLVKGTRGVASQIVLKYLQIKSIPVCIRNYTVKENTLDYCDNILSFSRNKTATVSNNVILLGKPSLKNFDEEENELIIANKMSKSNKEVFNTVIINKIKFHCTLYDKPKKSNDCVAISNCGLYVTIKRILQHSGQVFLIVREIKTTQRSILGSLSATKAPHLLVCSEVVYGPMRIVLASSVNKKCILVVVNENHYLVNFPNLFEKD